MTDRIISQDWRKRPKKFNVDRDWFEMVYSVELMPTWKIAETIGCVNEHVNAIAKKFGIAIRPRLKSSFPSPKRVSLDDKEIVRLYVEEKMAAGKIGKLFGCTHGPIAERLKELGVTMRHHNDTKRGSPSPHKIDIDPGVIEAMYAVKFNSAQTIADHFKVSRQVIDRIMKDSGIQKKAMGESRDMWGENAPRWRADLTAEEREKRRDMAAQKRWREKVYARDKYTCLSCGDDKGGNLHAHHIVPHSKDKTIAWEVSNGATMCKTCHVAFHKAYGYTKCTADDLSEYMMKAIA